MSFHAGLLSSKCCDSAVMASPDTYALPLSYEPIAGFDGIRTRDMTSIELRLAPKLFANDGHESAGLGFICAG
jgi:hypothetical protein